jgi:hypothetical protein
MRFAGFLDLFPVKRDDGVERNPARLAGHGGMRLEELCRERRQCGNVDAVTCA